MGFGIDSVQRDLDTDRAALAALARDWAAAIVSNDPDRIASFMTDDWVIVSETGIGTRDDFLGFVSSGDLTHSAMEVVTEPQIQILGDVATVTMRATNTAHYQGQRFDANEWTTDVCVWRDGQWRCALSHITPAKEPG